MQVTDGVLREKIANYNKFRSNNIGRIFSTAELKTEFEKIGIPFNYGRMPFYLRFALIQKVMRNKYTLPDRPVYMARLSNAWKFYTVARRAA